MKRLLLGLLPWMAVTAAAMEDPRPAEVILTHNSPVAAMRLGDECYVPPSVFNSWGWPYSLVQSEATIQADGRVVRVPAKTIDSRIMIPLRATLDQLGGGYSWRDDVLQVWSRARLISLKNGKLTIDGTLNFKPVITTMDSPSRLVIELKGMKLDSRTKIELPIAARAAQFSADSVRIVWQTEQIPHIPSDAEESTRSLILDTTQGPGGRTFLPPKAQEPRKDPPRNDPPKVDPGSVNPPRNEPKPSENPTPVAGQPVEFGPVRILRDDSGSASLSIPVSSAVPNVKFDRPDPSTLVITVPNGKYTGGSESSASGAIRQIAWEEGSNSTSLTIHLARPMGVEFVNGAREIQIGLTKPKIGNGKLAGKVIVVDAGHGGHDSGARHAGKGVNEKDLTLAISKLLSAELTAQGASVIMTRKTDVFIPLGERAAIANRAGADMFLSVHINSNKTAESRSGGITFYHGKDKVSQTLAECVQNEIKKLNQIPSIGVWSDTRIHKSGFAVLRLAKMPAILIETGFINHSKDLAKMTSAEFQNQFAKAIVAGVRVYLGDAKAQD
jgi:N-acetylmuramoyl-L-alanine amidase